MKHCVYCGEILNDDAKFCTKCGKPVDTPKTEVKEEKKTNNKSGLGFGIAAICCFIIPILSFVFGGVSVYYGVKNKGTAQIVCGVIGIVLGLCSSIIWALVWAGVFAYVVEIIIQILKDNGVVSQLALIFNSIH